MDYYVYRVRYLLGLRGGGGSLAHAHARRHTRPRAPPPRTRRHAPRRARSMQRLALAVLAGLCLGAYQGR